MVSSGCKTGIVATVGTLGVVIIILASTLGWIWYPDFVNKVSVLTSDNPDIFELWVKPPVPIVMQYFLFDCTNCNDSSITDRNFRPNLIQHGPFTYLEDRIKFELTEADGILGYRENTTYFYDPIPDRDDDLEVSITTVNPIYYTIMALVNSSSNISDTQRESVSLAVHRFLTASDVGETPFMTHTADELLFTGWSLTNLVNAIFDLIETVAPDVTLPPRPDEVVFGLLSTTNFTNPGNFTIESGKNDINQLGEILTFQGSESLNFWDDEYCDMLNGTDGAIYPPAIPTTNRVYLFTADLCRSLYATYEKEVSTLDIKGNRFTVPEEVLDGGSADNACFCKLNKKPCQSKGILDLRACSLGAPLVLSIPHFYQGSEYLVKAVEGLNPNKEEHETHFDLEPALSVPLFASKRIQLNLDVRGYNLPENTTVGPAVRPFYWMPDIIFPVLWLNESAKIDQAFADDINYALGLFVTVDIVRWCVLSVGIVLFVVGIIMAIVLHSQRKKKQYV